MIKNIHERVLPGAAGPLIDRLTELWPPQWGQLKFDRPFGVGADGGHGPIRYSCTAFEPGRRVEFTFAPVMGLNGTHTFVADGNVLRHTLVGTPRLGTRLRWALVIRWLHDACLEDLLDNAERELGREPARPSRWSPWVRLVRRIVVPKAPAQQVNG
ncbi:hypothetical protein Lesp02_19340 [Lentzea sp. NBRC 105346]|uniref:SRPBCC family protein n=1 Tax=Lentzea sp. NBRC 105346 TaxID=3032205 RepID=UPI0024A22B3F|nr:SRPBCC family protein [Lentzea sp. NBRC 105346]GLZ29744.1 hypothetical protein Lesp02_19340 [Lentzea sp. NBRC 105346]